MAEIFGYGIDLSKLRFTDEDTMKDFIRKYLPDYAKDMENDLAENNRKGCHESVFDYIENYDSMGYTGLPALLADVINEQENTEHFAPHDSVPGCVYLPANFPWAFNSVEKLLTPESMNCLFRKYLNQITDDPIVCEDLVLYEESMD